MKSPRIIFGNFLAVKFFYQKKTGTARRKFETVASVSGLAEKTNLIPHTKISRFYRSKKLLYLCMETRGV